MTNAESEVLDHADLCAECLNHYAGLIGFATGLIVAQGDQK